MLLVAMAKEAQRSLDDYSLEDLSDMAWAIAQLGGEQPAEVNQFLDLIPDAVCIRLQQASQVCHLFCFQGLLQTGPVANIELDT